MYTYYKTLEPLIWYGQSNIQCQGSPTSVSYTLNRKSSYLKILFLSPTLPCELPTTKAVRNRW